MHPPPPSFKVVIMDLTLILLTNQMKVISVTLQIISSAIKDNRTLEIKVSVSDVIDQGILLVLTLNGLYGVY